MADWISLELLSKGWRGAMMVQWGNLRRLNGKEVAIAIRMQNGPELRWRQLTYQKTNKDRKLTLAGFRDWIIARCPSQLTELRDIFTTCMSIPADCIHANILEEFLRYRDLRVLDLSQVSPHLGTVARMFEEMGETLEDINMDNGVLAQSTGTRNVTGAVYLKGKKSDIGLAETNGTLQRCFKSLEKLRRLNVAHCELANGLFLCSLPHPETLTHLDISYSPTLKYKEIIHSGFFLRCTSLRELTIRLAKSDDKMERVKLLVGAMGGLTSLETLNLSGWEATKGMGSGDLAEALTKLTRLKSLSLENTKGLVKEDFLQEVCCTLKNLECLEISVGLLNSPECFQSLSLLSKLHTLKLSMTVPKLIPKEAFQVFAELPCLKELDLGLPAYGSDLTDLYRGSERLETIRISGMAATDELLLEWAQKLPKNVANLHIRASTPEESYRRQGTTPPGDSGLIAILAERADTLRSLFLSRTAITDVGLRKIGGSAKNLREFGLYTTKTYKFTEAGLQALVDGCGGLREVFLHSFVKDTFGEVRVPPGLVVSEFE